MAALKKKPKAKGGGLWGPVLPLALLGAIGGFFWLGILLPVVLAPGDEAPAGLRLVYPEGDNRPDGQWRTEMRRINAGPASQGSARFSAGDVNGMIREVINFDPVRPAGGNQGKRMEFYPVGVNFRLLPEETQVVLVLRTGWGGKNRDVHLLVRGDWRKRGDRPTLAVRQSYLNSARLPAPLGALLFRQVVGQMAAAGSDSEMLKAWGRLKEVQSGDGWLEVSW